MHTLLQHHRLRQVMFHPCSTVPDLGYKTLQPRVFAKRCFDILASLIGMVALSPLGLLIAFLIGWDDGGPVLFSQKRAGQYRTPLRVFKFRTMRAGKVTRHGRWLRASGLDELPQLAQILYGQMSVVGPRPLTEADIVRLGWDLPVFASRWDLKPGLTGLAQVFARTREASEMLDRAYGKCPSLTLDLEILAVSVLMSFLGRKRTRDFLDWHRYATPQAVPDAL